MAKDVSRILAIAEPIAAERGLEVLDIEVAGGGSNLLVRVLLDSPDEARRVGVDDCQAVSQRLGDGLDAYEVLPGRYMLEVSSPGVNRPLKTPAHFARAVGQRIRVRFEDEDGSRRSRIGRLEAVAGDGIEMLDEQGQSGRVPFARIEKANLEFEFEAAAPPRRAPARKKKR